VSALDWLSPVMAVNVRQARKIRTLTALVHRMMRDNARLEHQKATTELRCELLSRRLAQKDRDCALVVQMAKDPRTAELFLRTQHQIDGISVRES